MSTIDIQNISKQFIKNNFAHSVLQSVSVTFRQDSSYAIMGDSGSGKTTLMHIIAGFEKQDSGTIVTNKKNSIACMFQKPYLSSELSIVENVLLAKIIAGTATKTDYKQAADFLQKLNIVNITQKCSTLSGGQQQKISFLRALFAQPAFLLADEPTAFLDATSSTELLDLLLTQHKEKNIGLVVITHDKSVAQRMDEVYELQNGKLFKKDF